MSEASIRLKVVKPKKSVVRFDYYSDDVAYEDRKPQLITSIYIDKKIAEKEMGVNLAKVRGVEVTIRALKEKS